MSLGQSWSNEGEDEVSRRALFYLPLNIELVTIPWSRMVSHGQPWSAMVIHGRRVTREVLALVKSVIWIKNGNIGKNRSKWAAKDFRVLRVISLLLVMYNILFDIAKMKANTNTNCILKGISIVFTEHCSVTAYIGE